MVVKMAQKRSGIGVNGDDLRISHTFFQKLCKSRNNLIMLPWDNIRMINVKKGTHKAFIPLFMQGTYFYARFLLIFNTELKT